MVARLIPFLVLVPLVELALLIEVGRRVGTLPILLLIVVTAATGALLLRSQGLSLLVRIRHDLRQGKLPADGLLDGLLVLVGAILLFTPGLISDAIGFACLLPVSRGRIKAWMGRKLRRWIENGSIRFFIR